MAMMAMMLTRKQVAKETARAVRTTNRKTIATDTSRLRQSSSAEYNSSVPRARVALLRSHCTGAAKPAPQMRPSRVLG